MVFILLFIFGRLHLIKYFHLIYARSWKLKKVSVQFDQFILFSGKESEASGSSNLSAVTSKKSELFDHIVYLSEVCDVMAIAMAELPNLLSPPDVAEALLRLKFGPQIICHMVANQPDSFNEGE